MHKVKALKWSDCLQDSPCFFVLQDKYCIIEASTQPSSNCRPNNQKNISFSSLFVSGSLPCFMYQGCLLSHCLMLVILSRSKGSSPQENQGAQEVFRPDVAYNLLHTFFYGLLAFSTMRWAWTLAHARMQIRFSGEMNSQVPKLVSFPVLRTLQVILSSGWPNISVLLNSQQPEYLKFILWVVHLTLKIGR